MALLSIRAATMDNIFKQATRCRSCAMLGKTTPPPFTSGTRPISSQRSIWATLPVRDHSLASRRLPAPSGRNPCLNPAAASSLRSIVFNRHGRWSPTPRPTLSPRHPTSSRNYSTQRTSILEAGPDSAFWVLLALNTIPFLAWTFAHSSATGPSQLRVRAFMEKHFLYTEASAKDRPWTFLTHGFSHQGIAHFAFNMISLRTCCSILAAVTNLGAAPVFALQIAGVIGGVCASTVMMRRWRAAARERGDSVMDGRIARRAHLGASGGVSACLVAAACYAPKAPIQLFLIPIDIPLAAFVGLYMLFDAYSSGNPTSSLAHEAHVGGGMTGALFWALFRGR